MIADSFVGLVAVNLRGVGIKLDQSQPVGNSQTLPGRAKMTFPDDDQPLFFEFLQDAFLLLEKISPVIF